MKIKSLFFSILAMSLMLVGCQKENAEEGTASMKLDPATLNFEKTASSQTVQVTCNRDWKVVDTDFPEWVTLTVNGQDIKGQTQKASSSPVTVTVTVLANEGTVRSASIVFNGGSLAKKTLTVNQDGIPVYHGDGTLEKPYSASDAIEAAGKLADGQEVEVYVKGIISTIKELDAGSFGNATYYISDDGQTGKEKEFYIYRGYYLNGEKFTAADQIKVGDEVVVFGKLINFKGNTPELSQGNKIITHNGVTPEPPKPITGENLLTNPGFEEWSGDAPVAWMVVSSNATIAKETTQVHGGAASISIEGSTSNKRVMSKAYNLKAGTYQLGLYAKGEGQLRIGYALLDAEGKVADTSNDYKYLIDPVVAGTDWTLHSSQFTLDKTTKVSIIIMNSSKGGGKSFFADDVELVTENGGIDDSGESAISLDKTTLSVAAEAGSQKVNVTSTVAWTATSDADWVTVSPTTGTANAEVTLTIAANEGAARNATVTFAGTAAKDKATVVVSQAASSDVPAGDGTLDNPYNVSEVIAFAKTLSSTEKKENVYVKGVVSQIDKPEDILKYGNVTYYISDDGKTAVQFQIYQGLGLNGEKFVSQSQLVVGDQVLVQGTVKNYNGNTPEMDKGSKLITTSNTNPYLSVSPETISVNASATSAQFNVNSNIESWTCSVDNGASVDKDSGSKSQTVTVTFEANTDTENAKTYTVTVKGGDITKTVTITQSKNSVDKYVAIDKIANLAAGTYLMAGFLESYDNTNYKPYSYHFWNGTITTGSNGDLNTMSYSFESGVLTKNPEPTSDKMTGEAAEVTLVATGAANTYYVMCGGKYLVSKKSATNRSLDLQDTPAEWVASNGSSGGIVLTGNGVNIGTAGAASALIRSYKAATSLKYGLVFFKTQ